MIWWGVAAHSYRHKQTLRNKQETCNAINNLQCNKQETRSANGKVCVSAKHILSHQPVLSGCMYLASGQNLGAMKGLTGWTGWLQLLNDSTSWLQLLTMQDWMVELVGCSKWQWRRNDWTAWLQLLTGVHEWSACMCHVYLHVCILSELSTSYCYTSYISYNEGLNGWAGWLQHLAIKALNGPIGWLQQMTMKD